jgi:hypothetical protein
MTNIKRVSIFFRVFFQILFIAIPVIQLIGWMHAPSPIVTLGGMINMTIIPNEYEKHIFHVLTTSEKMMGFLVSVVPMAIELFILYSLIKLFRLYEQAEIFSINNVRYIRNIGYALLIGQLIQPFYQVVMGLVLTLGNPVGHHLRFVAITLDQTNIGIILTGLLVILISWIMAEGCKLREEQQLTI